MDGHMGAPFHGYTCAGGGQILKNWGKAEPKCAVVSWLRLQTTTDCISHLYWKYKKILSTFICCGWAYGSTLTLSYNCAGGGQILENWGNAGPKWLCGVVVEAVNNYWLQPTSILDVFNMIEHLHMLWMGMWVHPYTVIPVQVGAQFWKIGVRRSPNDDMVSWLRL